MTAAILQMEKSRRRMTPDEFNKRLAALGPNKHQATVRWEQGIAKLSCESQWTNQELGKHLNLSPSHVGRIVTFGFWLENEPPGLISDSVSEKLFRKCWQQTAKGKKQAKTDDMTRCLLVTPLVEAELARIAKESAQPKLPKLKPSKTEAVTLQSLVKPGRWEEAKKLIDATALIRVREMTASLRGFYEKQTAEAKAAKAEYNRLSRKVNQIMTQAEFRLIRSCLHPDRQDESERKKYDRAFEIFNRIGEPIAWD